MKILKLSLIVLFAGFQLLNFQTPAFASTEDGDRNWVSFDSIVSELSSSQMDTPSAPTNSGDPFENIKLHAGIGLATSYIFLSPQQSARVSGFLRGIEANLGIDLFSRNWLAEGSMRSFQTEELDKNSEISLKEFDLKLVYHDHLSNKMHYKFSTGIAARYLDYQNTGLTTAESTNQSTPAAILATGLRAQLSPAISIGGDIGYRWALVKDTIDDSAIDAGLRLDAQF